MKESVRTSTAWRSFTPSCFSGSSFRNAPKSSASNFFVGANCQRIGPSLSPSSDTPEPRKRCTDSPASASTLRLVDEADGLQRKDKTVGRVGRPFGEGRRLEGRIVGAVDLDGRHLPAGIVAAASPSTACPDRRTCPTARRSSRPCRRGSFRIWPCRVSVEEPWPPLASAERVKSTRPGDGRRRLLPNGRQERRRTLFAVIAGPRGPSAAARSRLRHGLTSRPSARGRARSFGRR